MRTTRRHGELVLAGIRASLGGLLLLALAACLRPGSDQTQVWLHIDGTDRPLSSSAPTVRALLDEQEVELGTLDNVEPPLWTPLSAGTRITVTRQWEEIEQHPLTYTVQTVRDEFLAPSASRVITPGSAGLEELTYRVAYDGPTLLQRTLTSRCVLTEPVSEVRLAGTAGTLVSTPLSSTLAYLANGDAWVMRSASGDKRKLTEGGQLDGRVFALSPDGRTLLYSQHPANDDALNTLWSMDTVVLNAKPVSVGLTDVVRAVWSPAGDAVACVSGQTTAGTPGWKSLNDLQLLSWPSLHVQQVLAPNTSLLYAWWGEAWFWSPDGQQLAYAQADTIGVLNLASGQRHVLYSLTPAPPEGDQVWLPQLAWSPDGSALLATIYRDSDGEPQYDVILLDAVTGQAQTLYEAVGRDAAIAWSPTGERVALRMITRAVGAHGTLAEQATPLQIYLAEAGSWEQLTLVRPSDLTAQSRGALCWSPDGQELIVLCDGDLYLLQLTRETSATLTASGLVSHFQWRP